MLREIIDRRGLRYDKVAEALGMTKDRLSHILSGRRPATEDFYRLAAEFFGVPESVIRPAPTGADETRAVA